MDEKPMTPDLRLQIVIYSIILILIFVVGLVANFLVILILLFKKKFIKSLTHWYILQLAVADLMFLITIPFTLSQFTINKWEYGQEMCKFFQGILYINYYASILFLVIMTIDRYVTVCHHYSLCYTKFRKPSTSYIVTLFAWILAIGLATPFIIYSTIDLCECRTLFPPKKTRFDQCIEGASLATCRNLTSCRNVSPMNSKMKQNNVELPPRSSTFKPTTTKTIDDYWSNLFGNNNEESYKNYSDNDLIFKQGFPYVQRFYIWFNFIVMFVIPVLIMMICYTIISLTIWRIPVPKIGNGKTNSPRSLKKKKKQTYICVVLVLAFTLCWILYYTQKLVKLFDLHLTDSLTLTYLANRK